MHFRQIYIFIIIAGLCLTSCEKLPTDPGSAIEEIKSDEGLNYWGGSYNDEGHAVIQTADGGYAVAGRQYTSTSQQADLILAKFSSTLEFEDTTSLGTVKSNYANDIQQTRDGGYIIVGNTFNGIDDDVWVIKLGPDLTLAWEDTIKSVAGADDWGNSIQQMNSGNYVICGTSYDPVNDDYDIMVWTLSYDQTLATATPSLVFADTVVAVANSNTNDFGNNAHQTSDGGFIVVGKQGDDIAMIKLVSDGDGTYSDDVDHCTGADTAADGADVPQPTTAALCLDPNGDSNATGTAGTWSIGFSNDGFLTIDTGNIDEGMYVQQTSDGNYIVVGNTEAGTGQQSDVYINTVSSVGVVGSNELILGGAYDDKVYCVRQTSDGGFVFTGESYHGIDANSEYDVWAAKLTPALTVHWNYKFGGEMNDGGYSIAQTDDGGYIITGYTMSYGNQHEVVLLKLDSDGIVEDIIGKINESSGN